MEIVQIMSALRRNSIGAALIAVQVALTLAIVCNALFLAQQQVKRAQRPSGVAEADIVTFNNFWTNRPEDLVPRLQTDLAALRSMPDVLDAYATDGFPLLGAGYETSVGLTPDIQGPGIRAALYPVDDHALRTLGVRLVAGRNFTPDEIIQWNGKQHSPADAPVALVTRALAASLYPDGNALGKTFYAGESALTIVGIIERLQMQKVYGRDVVVENSMLTPYLWAETVSLYVIRAKPGRADAVLQAARKRLLDVSRARVIVRPRTFAEIRSAAYRPYRASAVILSFVSVLLLAITALGVVGLTSFWVARRHHQIGIRRALGARRVDILRYFHIENLVVVGFGAMIGLALAAVANVFIVRAFETTRMPESFVAAAVIAVLGLGQLSVLWPALRAAAVPPASAARGA